MTCLNDARERLPCPPLSRGLPSHSVAEPHRFEAPRNSRRLARCRTATPRLSKDKAIFLAHHSGKSLASGEVTFNSDPFTKAVVRCFTVGGSKAAGGELPLRCVWVAGADSHIYKLHLDAPDDYANRKVC